MFHKIDYMRKRNNERKSNISVARFFYHIYHETIGGYFHRNRKNLHQNISTYYSIQLIVVLILHHFHFPKK